MTWNRRKFMAAAGAVLPSVMLSNCARAGEADWPGPDTPAGQVPKMPIGMNLAGIANWEPGFPFKNLMWGAPPWLTRNAGGGGPWDTEQAPFFSYDGDGYPLEVPLVTPGSNGVPQQIFTVLPGRMTPGRYVLYYDGEGDFDSELGTKILSRAPGRVVLHMSHDNNNPEMLVIARSVRGNHIRNIRVVAEGTDPATLASNPFREDFLDFLRPFHALRFMDWGATNNSLEDEWAGRRKPTFYTMTPGSGDAEGVWGAKPTPYLKMFAGGVAHEVMIQLANQLKIDPWFCIPHRATDDYIRRCSALFREKLDPDRRLYVEYSNEMWNWGFMQAEFMLNGELAGTLLERKGGTAWGIEDGKRKGIGHPERMGVLISRAMSLWLESWQGADRQRVTTVCAIQAGWPDTAIRTIEWCARDKVIDAASGTAYFMPDEPDYAEWEKRGAALTAGEVIRSMAAVIQANGRPDSDEAKVARRTRELGLKYLNYEGGQHIQPKGQQDAPYMPALEAAQSDPGMYDLYVQEIRQQRRLGSTLMCAYNSVGDQGSRYGSWGSKPSYATPNEKAPKYRALIDCNVPKST